MALEVNLQTLRWRLRDATAHLHERLDDSLGQLDLTQSVSYIQFLLVHANALPIVASGVAAHGIIFSNMQRLIGALQQDLTMLGVSASWLPASAPAALHLDPLAVGYVIGGSHFGKQVLARRHQKADDPLIATANNFLSSPAARAIWTTAEAQLTDVPGPQPEIDKLISNARHIFEIYLETLAEIRKNDGKYYPQYRQKPSAGT